MPTMTKTPHTNGSGPQADNSTDLRIDKFVLATLRRAGYHLHAAGYTDPLQVADMTNDELAAVPHCGGRSTRLIRFAVSTQNPVLLPVLFPSERDARIWRAKADGGRKAWASVSHEQRVETLRQRGILLPPRDSAPVPVDSAAPTPTDDPPPSPPQERVPLDTDTALQVARDIVEADERRADAERRLDEAEREHGARVAAIRADIDCARQDRAAALALLIEAARGSV